MKREATLLSLLLIFLATACAGDQGALDRAEAEKIVKQAGANAEATVVAANGKAQATQEAMRVQADEARLAIAKEEAIEVRKQADWEATRFSRYEEKSFFTMAAAFMIVVFLSGLGGIFLWRVWKTTGILQGEAELWKRQREGTLQLDNQTVQYIMALLTGVATEHETFVTIEDPDNKHLVKRETRK